MPSPKRKSVRVCVRVRRPDGVRERRYCIGCERYRRQRASPSLSLSLRLRLRLRLGLVLSLSLSRGVGLRLGRLGSRTQISAGGADHCPNRQSGHRAGHEFASGNFTFGFVLARGFVCQLARR